MVQLYLHFPFKDNLYREKDLHLHLLGWTHAAFPLHLFRPLSRHRRWHPAVQPGLLGRPIWMQPPCELPLGELWMTYKHQSRPPQHKAPSQQQELKYRKEKDFLLWAFWILSSNPEEAGSWVSKLFSLCTAHRGWTVSRNVCLPSCWPTITAEELQNRLCSQIASN